MQEDNPQAERHVNVTDFDGRLLGLWKVWITDSSQYSQILTTSAMKKSRNTQKEVQRHGRWYLAPGAQ